MKTFTCRDIGIDCDFVAEASPEEDIMAKITEHGKSVHSYKDEDFTEELVEKVKGAIKETEAE